MSSRGYNNRYNNNGGGHFAGNNNFNNRVNNYQNPNKFWFEIKGWTNATQDNLVSFISRKSNVVIRDVQIINGGDTIKASVNNKDSAETLKRLSGVRFAGNVLHIAALPDGVGSTSFTSSSTTSTLDLLKGFLNRRFNPQQRLLDLTNMAIDAQLQQTGMLNISFTKLFTALMVVAGEEPYKSGVDSLNLAENNIIDCSTITPLTQSFPKLKNLSLSNNNISMPRSLENFKHKLPNLQQLLLVNNPIVNYNQYSIEVMKIFPRLISLDGQPVRDEQKLMNIWKFPLGAQQFFFEDNNLQSLSTGFISNFLNLWDTNRNGLAQLYTQDSQFSMSISTDDPSISAVDNNNNNNANSSNNNWGYYLTSSRNFTKISNPNTKLNKGTENIIKSFLSLPKTAHKLSTNPDLFSTECWKVSDNAVMIVLHGEFEEVAAPEIDSSSGSSNPRNRRMGYRNNNHSDNTKKSLSKRSFDRSWFVVSAGSAFVIASDLLCIRPFTDSSAWLPKPQAPQATNAIPTAVPGTSSAIQNITSVSGVPVVIPPEIAAKLSLDQQTILTKIIQETKLNINFAGMLAEQSNWDLSTSITNFNASKANIPLDAYIQ